MKCQQCKILYINGVRCHEISCPLAWQDEVRVCCECGSDFVPESTSQGCCSEDCIMAWLGVCLPERKDFDLETCDEFSAE